MPRFLLDEHVWGGLVKVGMDLGLDVVLVQTRLPEGTPDEVVLAFAAREERVLLTSNALDFAPMAADWFLSGQEHWGIVIVPGQTDKSQLSRGLGNLSQRLTAEELKNTFRSLQEFI